MPELIHLLEEAVKLEEQGRLQDAYELCVQIDNDTNCSKSLKMTAERTMDRLARRQQEVSAPAPTNTTAETKTENICDVDVFVLEGIPHIENKMPIRPEDYNRIKDGIKKRGIINPLIALPNLKLVCGYNRLKIAKELGLKTVPVIFKDIPEARIVEYAMKDNIERRQLSTEQVAEYIADTATQGTGRPKKGSRDKTNEDIAGVLGVSERTVQRAKKFVKKVKENPQLKGQSIRSVIEGNEPVDKFTIKFGYTMGVGQPEQEMIDDSAEIINKIYDLDPQNGDKIKIITQVYLLRRK